MTQALRVRSMDGTIKLVCSDAAPVHGGPAQGTASLLAPCRGLRPLAPKFLCMLAIHTVSHGLQGNHTELIKSLELYTMYDDIIPNLYLCRGA